MLNSTLIGKTIDKIMSNDEKIYKLKLLFQIIFKWCKKFIILNFRFYTIVGILEMKEESDQLLEYLVPEFMVGYANSTSAKGENDS